ncbi:DUF3459 domain-containing protein (plasmid) [Roseivivax marinus]|uniref:alpha-amylase family glycosyl hydrolase n=1 Tax=Roseivivax marinus TaxID=1379903 RepID=UPI001F03DB2C|nr:alpha-amylase family glycosyl hydrolase [Roseivivax marinus]UMA67118.1 DUF3459 domain-containing protein [Roseivivax marinus]
MTEMTKEALAADVQATRERLHEAPRQWWRDAVIYEVYVRSFRDTNQDGIGDLAGVLEKLDYIADLGADAVWLSPFYPSPQQDFGYDVTDLTGVDPRHGTLADFTDLVRAAHDRELRVLVDFIAPHTSDEHPWFQESRASRDGPRADWYVWADPAPDGLPPNNWLSSFGGPAWTWEPRRNQYYYHPFLECQPALDLENPAVREAIAEAMRFWFDLGADGMRLDAAQTLGHDRALRSNPPAAEPGGGAPIGGGPGNPFARQMHLFDRDTPEAIETLQWLRGVADEYDDPPRVLIGELADMDSARLAEKYTARGDALHAVYDFEMIQVPPDVPMIVDLLRRREQHLPTGWRLTAFGNHDAQRAVSNMFPEASARGKQREAAKLLLFVLFCLRGGSVLYQGEELGLPHVEVGFEDIRDPWGKNLWPDFPGRDGSRTPMPWQRDADHLGFCDDCTPWLPPAPEHGPLAVDAQTDDPNSPLRFTQAFLEWRKRSPALRWGDQRVEEASRDELILWHRWSGEEALLLAANFGLTACELKIEGGGQPIAAPGCVTHHAEGRMELPPLGFAVIRH